MNISVIIPTYNEEKCIKNCLLGLSKQNLLPKEIIVVDDGSVDKTVDTIRSINFPGLTLLRQSHKGPAAARNFGVGKATGGILVFVDSDMEFDPDFLNKLTQPIREGKSKGTFSKDEFVKNWDNVWARCWNINQNIKTNHRVPENYPDKAPVFRAILKSEFDRVGGYDNIGYTDDWTLSRKLGYQSDNAPGAIFYHRNPETLNEAYKQARWIGKNEFITGSFNRKIINLIKYSLPCSMSLGLVKGLINCRPEFPLFKIVYDFGVFVSILKSFTRESKAK